MQVASTSTPTQSAEEKALILFAKSTLNLLTFWPALRIAVSQGWGSGSAGRTHLAEDLVDLFYNTASSSSTSPSASFIESAVPDVDDIEDVLLHVLSHEYSLTLEDNSERIVARDLISLWKECLQRSTGSATSGPHTGLIEKFEMAAEKARMEDGTQRYQATRAAGNDSDSEDDTESGSEDDDNAMDQDDSMDGVSTPPQTKKKEGPVIDEDGFQMVSKKGGRS